MEWWRTTQCPFQRVCCQRDLNNWLRRGKCTERCVFIIFWCNNVAPRIDETAKANKQVSGDDLKTTLAELIGILVHHTKIS